jgi:GTP-binding nuclear protein Ran
MATFRFLILGDGGVGKTSFIDRHKTLIKKDCEFLDFETTSGQDRETLSVCIEEVSSCAQPLGGNLNFEDVHAVIIMFDLTNMKSYRNAKDFWYAKCPRGIPLIFLGNKYDSKNKAKTLRSYVLPKNTQYLDVSVKTGYNIREPFLYLLREVTGDGCLVFDDGLGEYM